MKLNLYQVMDSNYDWCCYAFDFTRNKARLAVAQEFDFDYTATRCKTLAKNVDVPRVMLVTSAYDEGYDKVTECGWRYDTEEWESHYE